VRALGLLNRELRVRCRNGYVYIPLTGMAVVDMLKEVKSKIPSVEFNIYSFKKGAKSIGPWWRLLEEEIPPHVLAFLPRSVDFVGDIAIVELAPELHAYKRRIGEVLLEVYKNVKTVLAKASVVTGTYRLREYEVIAGEKKTTTVHKEYGLMFHVDLAKVYFSPRLSYEHSRVSSLVNEGETVLDMFTGVGSFAVHIAKKHKNVVVYAVDINPEALKLLEKNLLANRVVGKVTAFLGDAREIVQKQLRGATDRVIMNLPENAYSFVDVACEALKSSGGILHYYEFAEGSKPMEKSKLRLIEAVEKSNRTVTDVLATRIVRAVAPFKWQVVVDAYIK